MQQGSQPNGGQQMHPMQYMQQMGMMSPQQHPLQYMQHMMSPHAGAVPGTMMQRTQTLQGADSSMMTIQNQLLPPNMQTPASSMTGPSPWQPGMMMQPQFMPSPCGLAAQPGTQPQAIVAMAPPHPGAGAVPLALPAPPLEGLFADDDHKLSTSYRMLGAIFKNGPRGTIPKKVRSSCIHRHDPGEWTLFRLSLLEEAETDCLVYVISGIKPCTRISDLHCRTKGQLRDAIAGEARRVAAAQPERLRGLAHDLSNVVREALRLGFDADDLPKGFLKSMSPDIIAKNNIQTSAVAAPTVQTAQQQAVVVKSQVPAQQQMLHDASVAKRRKLMSAMVSSMMLEDGAIDAAQDTTSAPAVLAGSQVAGAGEPGQTALAIADKADETAALAAAQQQAVVVQSQVQAQEQMLHDASVAKRRKLMEALSSMMLEDGAFDAAQDTTTAPAVLAGSQVAGAGEPGQTALAIADKADETAALAADPTGEAHDTIGWMNNGAVLNLPAEMQQKLQQIAMKESLRLQADTDALLNQLG